LKLINEENQLIKDYILDQRLNFSQHNTYIKDFNPRLYGKTDAEMMFDKSIWQYGGGMLSNVISSSSMLLFISFFAEGLEGPFIPMIFYFGSSFTTSNALSQMAEVKYPANHFFSSYPEDEIRLYKKVYKERTLELRRNAIITGHFQTVVYSFLFGVVLGLALN
jgi:hypothetical protein